MNRQTDEPVIFDNCLLYGRKTSTVKQFAYNGSTDFDVSEVIGLTEIRDLDVGSFRLRDCVLSSDPMFRVVSESAFDADFRLKEYSPAKGAASDGLDIAAIPDQRGWPLV